CGDCVAHRDRADLNPQYVDPFLTPIRHWQLRTTATSPVSNPKPRLLKGAEGESPMQWGPGGLPRSVASHCPSRDREQWRAGEGALPLVRRLTTGVPPLHSR